ncbi:hypothetical protein ISCGN_006891 [Ixodes scapularis]
MVTARKADELYVAEERCGAAIPDLNKISDYKVSVTPHRTLNSCKGVISEDDLLESSEEAILEGLSGQGVVAVRRIFIRRDGQERPSKHLVLTFASSVLPENIKAGYLHCKVRPYIPNPRRCFKCQRFGHSSVTCRGKTTCAKCGATDHPADTCEGTLLKCVNCSGAHPSYSRVCPKFQEEKKILKLKIKENLTYPEASKRFSFLQGGTYAEAAARGAAPPLKATVGTQYSLRDLECSPSLPNTSEASVGSQTPAALPKAPRARTVPHRPGPKPRVVLDTTPSQSSEGATPSTSQREEEAMEVSVDPTEPPPPAKRGGTCESRCLESGVSTDPEPRRGHLRLRCLVLETSVGSQTPEAPQKLTKSKAFPQRLAPKGVEEAMEVNVPSTEGSMEIATPVPSCSKAGNVSSAPLKKSAQASQVPAGSSGRGRAQPTRLTDNPRKPGHSDEAVSLKGPEVSTEEKMEEASLASDDDLLPSGAESLSSSAALRLRQRPTAEFRRYGSRGSLEPGKESKEAATTRGEEACVGANSERSDKQVTDHSTSDEEPMEEDQGIINPPSQRSPDHGESPKATTSGSGKAACSGASWIPQKPGEPVGDPSSAASPDGHVEMTSATSTSAGSTSAASIPTASTSGQGALPSDGAQAQSHLIGSA